MKKLRGIFSIFLGAAMALAPGRAVEKQIHELTEATTAATTDLVEIESFLTGAFRNRKMTLANLRTAMLAQPLDSDLTLWGAITPSANAQSFAGAADYSAMRTLLSLVPGTNVQAFDSDLALWAGLTPSANMQSFAVADYAGMRTQLGLVIGTNVQAYDADLTTWAGISPSANMQSLAAAADYAAMRTLLSLGNVENTALSTWAGTANVTTLGTIGTGTWNATAIADGKIASALTGKTYNGLTITSTTGTLTIAAGKTLTVSNSITFASTDGTTMTLPSTSATIARTDAAQTFTGVQTFSGALNNSAASGASAPAEYLTGAIYAAGTGTTTFPHFFIQPTGATAATTWATTGTAIGVNVPTGFAGAFFDLKTAGITQFSVSSTGNVNIAGGTSLSIVGISTLSRNAGTGALTINTNGAGITLTPNNSIVSIGGTTSSFPALKRNATGVDFRLADDSAYAPIAASQIELGAASDTTIARSGAGAITVEGVNVPTVSSTDTFSNKTQQRNAALGTDDTLTGETIAGLNNSGGVTQWDAVYLNGSSAWVLADANGSGTYPCRGLATTTQTTGVATTIVTEGTVRNDAWNWTPGGTVYLSTTAGGLTQTAPATTGDKIQVVGYALTADIMMVQISPDYGTAP